MQVYKQEGLENYLEKARTAAHFLAEQHKVIQSMHQWNAVIEDQTENISLHEGLTAVVRGEEIPAIFLAPEPCCLRIYSETWEPSPKDTLWGAPSNPELQGLHRINPTVTRKVEITGHKGASIQEEVRETIQQKSHKAKSSVDQLGWFFTYKYSDWCTWVWSTYLHFSGEDVTQMAHGSLSNADAHIFREDLCILANPDTNF